jgi:hypothetical protein
MTVVRLIRDGLLPARQACVGAPYVIRVPRDLIEKTTFLVVDRVILRDHWRAHAVLPAG